MAKSTDLGSKLDAEIRAQLERVGKSKAYRQQAARFGVEGEIARQAGWFDVPAGRTANEVMLAIGLATRAFSDGELKNAGVERPAWVDDVHRAGDAEIGRDEVSAKVDARMSAATEETDRINGRKPIEAPRTDSDDRRATIVASYKSGSAERKPRASAETPKPRAPAAETPTPYDDETSARSDIWRSLREHEAVGGDDVS
jgi:hypothetical protein